MDLNVNNRVPTTGAFEAPKIGTPAEPLGKQETQPQNGLTVTIRTADVQLAEPTLDIPDAALTRDDPLGDLVKTAFNLPPPPMPNFE